MLQFKHGQLNILLGIAFGMTAILCLVFGIFMYRDKQPPIQTGNIETFDEAWILRAGVGRAEPQAIDLPYKLEKNTKEASKIPVTITHKVPEQLESNTALLFKTFFQSVIVEINGERIYSYGIGENRPFGKNPPPSIHVIPIDESHADLVLDITFQSNSPKYRRTIGNIEYGNIGDLHHVLWRRNGISFIEGIVILILSIILAVIVFFMGNYRKGNVVLRYIMILHVLFSIYIIYDNDLIRLFTGNMYFAWLLKSMLLFIIPIVYFMYIRCFADKKNMIQFIDIGIIIFGIQFISAVVFQVFGLLDYNEYLGFHKILIMLTFLIYTVILGLAVNVYGKKSLFDNVIANIVCMTFICIEWSTSVFKIFVNMKGVWLTTGLFCFIIGLLIATERNVLRRVDRQKAMEEDDIAVQQEKAVEQINPALIFEAFSDLQNKIKENAEDGARFLYYISQYIRCNLNSILYPEMIPFEEELEHIAAYLHIKRTRHKNLETEIENKVTDFYVPRLSIEPIVENAVQYGIEKNGGKGIVKIRSYARKNEYAIQVIDNGAGFQADKLKKENITSLKKIKERIEKQCRGSVEIVSQKGKGTVITILLSKTQNHENL